MVISMPISSWFRTAFASKDVHGSRTLLEPPLQHFHAHFRLIYGKLSRKKSLLVRSEIVGLFCNTLTLGHMESRHRWEKLREKVQALLFQKRKTFSPAFIAFSESTKNFHHSEKKGQLHSLNILEVIDSRTCCYFNARKLLV